MLSYKTSPPTRQKRRSIPSTWRVRNCGISLPDIEPRTFSFNSPHGACPVCTGLGIQKEFDADLIIPNKQLSLDEGAILPWHREGNGQHYMNQLITATAQSFMAFLRTSPLPGSAPSNSRSSCMEVAHGDIITVNYINQYGRQRTYDTTYEGDNPDPSEALSRVHIRLCEKRDGALHDGSHVPPHAKAAASNRRPSPSRLWG